jgi:predicted nucleotidyltransferase component of viral defense system
MRYDTPEDQLVREALQARLLAELFSQNLRKEFVLKGGLALRMGYGSHRATKDIDLDSPQSIDKAHVQAIVRRAIARALTDGMIESPVVTTPKQTDTTLRYKIGGRLKGGVSEIHLTVEISRRQAMVSDHVVSKPLQTNASSAPVMIDVYDGSAIASTKVIALTSPNRNAPRDLYDLAMLIDMKIEPPVELLARRGKEQVESSLSELWSKIESMTWDRFREEVIPFLEPSIGMKIDESTFSDMQLKVGEHVESWLKSARSRLGP